MGKRISLKEIQDLTGMAYKTVKKRLEDASVAPLGESGKSIIYDSVRALEAIYAGKQKDGNEDFRTLLVEEQHREKKRENDIAEGLIAPVSLISDTIIKTGVAVMSQLEALPGMMKRANPELTAHDINTVKKTISQCCQAISEMKLD
jgi:phage terminase Nu1 subunit (DNA packaging protein)